MTDVNVDPTEQLLARFLAEGDPAGDRAWLHDGQGGVILYLAIAPINKADIDLAAALRATRTELETAVPSDPTQAAGFRLGYYEGWADSQAGRQYGEGVHGHRGSITEPEPVISAHQLVLLRTAEATLQQARQLAHDAKGEVSAWAVIDFLLIDDKDEL